MGVTGSNRILAVKPDFFGWKISFLKVKNRFHRKNLEKMLKTSKKTHFSMKLLKNLCFSTEKTLIQVENHTWAWGGGLDPPEFEIPYPDPTQNRCLGKILTKKRVFKAFLSDFQTCLRHYSENCPTQIFGAAHVW